ncbi:hypothetical protein RA307_28080, partial [Xanthobacteraceae bacterium Astr-EGSB]|uniref:hypothetical protein n=1 Tax=Astrobacterium formosum TaxID=3069710 RepID=UPI0027B55FFA|nr:hypothetical protein [Xanthobacteraceae bacterium Astr-EGSB]
MTNGRCGQDARTDTLVIVAEIDASRQWRGVKPVLAASASPQAARTPTRNFSTSALSTWLSSDSA